MGNWGPLIDGFAVALSPQNLVLVLVGSVLGTIVGVLPGLGPTAGISILLVVTSTLDPIPAIIMLAAIFYGASYGGSTTSILMNIPGEVSSVVTCIDGHQMARQGRAAQALAIAAISSFVAGTVGVIALTFFAPALADIALSMGPPEIFGLIIFSFTMVASMAGASLLKGVTSAAFGMMICLVGMDPTSGVPRFTFDSITLLGGFDLIAVLMGLFAIKEVFKTVGEEKLSISDVALPPWYRMISFREIVQCIPAIFRSSALGFPLGCLPGISPGLVTFLAYDFEKKVSRNSEHFGKGAIEGVASPEGANNACASGGFVPLLALGIPPHASLAVLMGGLMVYGLQPGPLIFQKQPEFVWAVIASMYIGNVALLVLNLPLVGLWAKIAKVPYYYIGPVILLVCFIGVYTVRHSYFDVWVCLAFGIIGFLLEKADIPVLPLVLALVLTPMLEDAMRQSMAMGAGSLAVLCDRPIALTFIGLALVALALSLYVRFRFHRALQASHVESA